MPAAAVIPAPIVYIKVAVIKTLVVELYCGLVQRKDANHEVADIQTTEGDK